MSRNYKKYEDQIKEMVIRSGDPEIFPNLKIPRSTALYWIKNSKKKIRVNKISIEDSVNNIITNLKKELEVERAKNIFMSSLLAQLNGVKEKYSHPKNKETIVALVIKFSRWISIEKLCKLIHLQSSKFYTFKLEVLDCERIGFKKCKLLAANQMTFKEQSIIYDLLHEKSLRHLSIKRLQYYAFRKGLITCGYDTWRKYALIFNKGRITKRKKRKRERQGIRASKTNQIWHIDITEFKLSDEKKAYLQVIVDNFSRKVLTWSLSHNKDESLSIKTMLDSLRQVQPDTIMSDAGGENIGFKLNSIYTGYDIRHQIAKKDTSYTNSMVESFFYILKNSFIQKDQYYSFGKLYNQLRRAISKYNQLPAPVHNGATPNEIYSGVLSIQELKNKFSNQIQEALERRSKENRLCFNRNVC